LWDNVEDVVVGLVADVDKVAESDLLVDVEEIVGLLADVKM
jgi:hypothetical protein